MSNKRKCSYATRLQQSGQREDGPYFATHPTTTAYQRPATAQELRLTGLPAGTMVAVRRFGGQRMRAFVPPDERQN